MKNYKSLALAILVFMIIISAMSSFRESAATKRLNLDRNDSLTFTRTEYSVKILTYEAHAGDTVKLAVIDLDKPSMKILEDRVLSKDDEIVFKIKDLFFLYRNAGFFCS